MRYLSLFSGIEAATQAWQSLGWECVAVSEIEPFPCAVLEHHYPHVPNLGDVTKITEKQIKDLGQIDLIVFGSPCFVAGTTVISKDGLKPIESIVVGDEVLTHGNQFKPVISVGGNKDQDVYEVKASGLLPTIATAEHPYYARETKRVWNNAKRGWDRVYSKPEWVEVKDLKENNLLAIPVLQTSENTLNLTDEECFIVGRYIADGHTAKHYRDTEGRPNDRHWQLILSIGSHKVDDLAREVNDAHYGLYAHSDSTHRAVFSSKRLVEIVEAHCGCGAENKYLSTTLLNLPVDKLKRVIDGYVSGDGWLRGGTEYRVTTISVELVRSLQLAIAKVYHVATMTNFFERPKTTVIDGRTVNQKDTYIVSFRKERPKQAKYFYENGFIWTRFKSVTKLAGKQDVFNLEVADDNSYTANNAVVHNCQNLSVAGNRKGLQGSESSLFYAAMEIIKHAKRHCNTRFALWENVCGAFSSNKGADFTEVVKHMAGLSDLDTPTNGWGKEGAAVGSNGLLEWSVLDAQWFGLAQRRKRVFAIVDFGDWASRPPILLEREGLRGDSAPSRAEKQNVTADAQTSIAARCFDKQRIGQYAENNVASTCSARDYKDASDLIVCHGTQDPITNTETAYAMGCNNGQENVIAIAGNITGRTDGNGGNGNGFDESGACYKLTTNDRHAVAYCNKNRDDMVETCYNKGINHNGDNCHGSTQETNANKILRALRKEVGEEAFTQWGLGVSYSFLEKEVLRPLVHGKGIRCETIEGGHKVVNSALSRKKACAEGQLCELWQAGRERRTPQRWGLEEQCRRELGAYLSQLSQQGASNKTFMRDMWYASEGIGVLREALSEVQEIRRPYVDESKPAHASCAVRRLTPKEAERLQGFPDNWTKIPYRNKSADDCPNGVRYKALGNSMAVNVMAWIGKRIQQTQGIKSFGSAA